jgi:hypothetical protein
MEPSKTENLARELTVREAKLPEKVREWRAKLSTKAKQERRFRFYSLYGLISHLDTLRGGVGTGSRQPRGARSSFFRSFTIRVFCRLILSPSQFSSFSVINVSMGGLR